MLKRICLTVIAVLGLGVAMSSFASKPAAACSHHEKYDGV